MNESQVNTPITREQLNRAIASERPGAGQLVPRLIELDNGYKFIMNLYWYVEEEKDDSNDS